MYFAAVAFITAGINKNINELIKKKKTSAATEIQLLGYCSLRHCAAANYIPQQCLEG